MLNRRGYQVLIVFISLILLVVGCDSSSEPTEVYLQVTSPHNNDVFRTNIIKLTGTISPEDAEIIIQGTQAYSNDEGIFYSFLDLSPGTNVIDVIAVYYENSTSKSIAVNYLPALVINCSAKKIECDHIDENHSCLYVSGSVNIPQATVTVNGSPIAVSSGGTFSKNVSVQHQEHTTYLLASATWGEETDNKSIHVAGAIAPGMGIQHLSRMTYDYDNPVEISTGDLKTFGLNFFSGKSSSSKQEEKYSYEIYLLDLECSKTKLARDCYLPLPEGLSVNIEPDKFIIYDNTNYYSELTIEVAEDFEPGNYTIRYPFHGHGNTMHIKVVND